MPEPAARGSFRARVKRLVPYLGLAGLNPRVTARSARGLRPFVEDYRELKRQIASASIDVPPVRLVPYPGDRFEGAGSMSGHYFHQDLLTAQRIFELAPRRHIDVGSRTDGFVAHVAAFRRVEVFDIRPGTTSAANIAFTVGDLMAELPEHLVGCTDSVSSLHAIEHFGLGRYGDPVDLEGHLKAIANFHAMLEPGGRLHLSVPIGPDRLEFNAQRVLSVETVLGAVDGRFELERFSWVGDDGELRTDVEVTAEDAAASFGCTFGCGIFELIRLP